MSSFADRPETLDLSFNGGPFEPVVSASSYEPFGPLASLTFGNGLTETRDFDGRYSPAAITVGTIFDWQYTIDGVGNVTAIDDLITPAQSRTYDYQDIHYFLTQGNGPWGARSWTYDTIGNRLAETRDATTDIYSYVANPVGGNSPVLDQVTLGGGGMRSYSYDLAGNTTAIGQLELDYDQTGRLFRIDPGVNFPRTRMRYDGRDFVVGSVFVPDGAGRPHTSLGGMPPSEYAQQLLAWAGYEEAV